MEWVKIGTLLEKSVISTVTPTFKLQNSDIADSGDVPVISQEKDFINGYTNNEDVRLKNGPFIVFGDHTECLKFVNFPFAQGADGIKIFKTDPLKMNSRYLYYALCGCYNKTGFYERHFKLLKKTCIPDYALDYQQNIVSVLSVYDDLIENNNKRIQILEQMAQELYKEWFVRFRFPGHEKVKYKDTCFGKIPDMFSLVKMQDVFEYYIGGGWGNEDSSDKFPVGAYVIRGTDFSRVIKGDISTLPFRYHKNSNYKSRQLKPYDIIIEISGGTSEQPVGRAIFITNNILNRLGNKAICASFCKLIRLQTNKISPMYFHYWMKYLYDTRFIDRFQLQSTGIINFKFEYFLRKGDVLLPSQEIMKNFECAIRPLHDQIDLLATINANLAKQRDLLLPRLMSGKLEIKGIPDA